MQINLTTQKATLKLLTSVIKQPPDVDCAFLLAAAEHVHGLDDLGVDFLRPVAGLLHLHYHVLLAFAQLDGLLGLVGETVAVGALAVW